MASTPSQTENLDANRLAFSIASFVLGGGIIAAVLAFTVIPLSDLFMWAVMVLLPILALGVGLGLISKSTYDMLKAATRGSSFGERVRHWVDELERNPNARPDARSVDNGMYA